MQTEINELNELEVNGVKYVRKGEEARPAQECEGMPFVIVRSFAAGCFAGFMATKDGQEVTLLRARRLWYWDGAASLSQLAEDGVNKPQNCKFPKEVSKIVITKAEEIISCTEKSQKSIWAVKEWAQQGMGMGMGLGLGMGLGMGLGLGLGLGMGIAKYDIKEQL